MVSSNLWKIGRVACLSASVSALIRPRSATTHTPGNGEAPAQPLNHRDDCGDLGGVARPHFRAHRPTVAVDHHRQDHLPKVRPEPCCPSVCPPAPSKYRLVEAGEQIAAVIEQSLLDHILQAARCKWRAAVLLLFPTRELGSPLEPAVWATISRRSAPPHRRRRRDVCVWPYGAHAGACSLGSLGHIIKKAPISLVILLLNHSQYSVPVSQDPIQSVL